LTGCANFPALDNAMAAGPIQEPRKKWIEYSSLGLMFPVSILVGFAIGFFLDKWLKTDPWLTIIFILYGILAGFYNLFNQTRRNEPKK
jgi:F0F1-type ATP synthase assembly protein I